MILEFPGYLHSYFLYTQMYLELKCNLRCDALNETVKRSTERYKTAIPSLELEITPLEKCDP